MAVFVSVSSPPFSFRCTPCSSLSTSRFCVLNRRFPAITVKCLPSGPEENGNSTPASAPSLSSSSSSHTQGASVSGTAYKWCTMLGGFGLMETAYLTYLKVSGSDAFCPVSGGTCADVLNSDYASVFGVPLPAIGMVMYGLVTALGAQLGEENQLPFGISRSNGRFMLLGTTAVMASASSYFLYILGVKLSDTSCLYCLLSAALSFGLFFLSLKDVKMQDVQQVVGLQLCMAIIVVASLTASYSNAQPILTSSDGIDLPYYAPEIATRSSPFALALAKHLNSIGAKMYGAFWCSHCLEQKQMFGREAVKVLNYVECFPDGYKNGTKIIKACADAGIEGFPTWVVNDQVISGEVELAELAEISGFSFDQAPKTRTELGR